LYIFAVLRVRRVYMFPIARDLWDWPRAG